ncbi:hypothetical protein [Burkholderia pyrrocinia]|uniref:hypothetical protein n=1 Tax=Burkholderia pyrrocinia TaxID=60550 RepID=UPI001377AEA8|nr:hypothetical protein [Burkholderia pyrrocinia]
MSVIRWPELFNEKARLFEGEAVRLMGESTLAGELCDCPRTLPRHTFVKEKTEYLR